MGAYEELVDYYESAPFHEKISMTSRVVATGRTLELDRALSGLTFDGFLEKVENKAVVADEGEHYVYLWTHRWGDPFYVGSGKGGRWLDKGGRCEEFYRHLDRADAVVYLVLRGVDSKTAHLYEKYLSVSLCQAGYNLANGDNNLSRLTPEARERRIASCDKISGQELTKRVEGALLEIVRDAPWCDYRVTNQFLVLNGSNYFSRRYKSGPAI